MQKHAHSYKTTNGNRCVLSIARLRPKALGNMTADSSANGVDAMSWLPTQGLRHFEWRAFPPSSIRWKSRVEKPHHPLSCVQR